MAELISENGCITLVNGGKLITSMMSNHFVRVERIISFDNGHIIADVLYDDTGTEEEYIDLYGTLCDLGLEEYADEYFGGVTAENIELKEEWGRQFMCAKGLEGYQLWLGDVAVDVCKLENVKCIKVVLLNDPSIIALFRWDDIRVVSTNMTPEFIAYLLPRIEANKEFLVWDKGV